MLDIIIPVYKNKQGLRRTLNSINTDYLDRIKVTVVDDESHENYNDIKEEFSFITLYSLEKNSGPGVARNYGIERTSEPYILFIDADDYFINENILGIVLQRIEEHPNIERFSWDFKIDTKLSTQQPGAAGIHGYVYKRDFLNQFNIRFSSKGSYADEDVGFNIICTMLMKNLAQQDFLQHQFTEHIPIMIYTTTDKNSITRSDQGLYLYTKHCKGLALNAQHVVETAYANNVEEELILDFISLISFAFYEMLISYEEARPNFTKNAWEGARIFYFNVLKDFFQKDPTNIDIISNYVVQKITKNKLEWPKGRTLNFRRFIKDLDTYEELPEWYKDEWT